MQGKRLSRRGEGEEAAILGMLHARVVGCAGMATQMII
jgi:hypothetical protein